MKHFTLVLLICRALCCDAQRLPVGIRFHSGIDMVVFDAKTRHYFDNNVGGIVASAIHYQNFFFMSTFNNPDSWSNDSLTLNDVSHPSSEQLRMEFWSWNIGYSFLIPNRRLSIDPYIGMHKSFIENHNQKVNYASQLGSSGGICVYYFMKPVLRDKFQWYWYLNNQFSFPQFYKLDPNLGKFYYSVGIGVGVRWGSMNDYWQRRFR